MKSSACSCHRIRLTCCLRCIVALSTLQATRGHAAPDTLVVCPAVLRPALAEWIAYRTNQHHDILVVDSPDSASQLRAKVREEFSQSHLHYVVLIGKVPTKYFANGKDPECSCTPTTYVRGQVNTRWGSDPLIASDIPFSDIDGDGLPDLSIGRIPAATRSQLASTLRKFIDYEQQSEDGDWTRKLKITSGNGGFGPVTDALIEAAARQIISQLVPSNYVTEHICASATIAGDGGVTTSFAARAQEQLSAGSFAWVYLGHGRVTELDRVPTSKGSESILSTADMTKLHCGRHSPLAVLVACYTGAMDASRRCLAEELLLSEEGPVAVIAASRVTMPYGNTVLGCELLRACFRDRPEHLGDTLRLAERRTLSPAPDDPLRMSLDSLAAGLSPTPIDLAAERREHVWMYHLFGDPLLHLHYCRPAEVDPGADHSAASP